MAYHTRMDQSYRDYGSDRPWKWTDEKVAAFLTGQDVPLDRWRVSDGLYGYIDADGTHFLAMDDDDDRVERIVLFLRKIGASELN
jgi:hypothetical protein